MPPKVISGGDNPYDIHDAKLSSSATAHESSSVTAHEISNMRIETEDSDFIVLMVSLKARKQCKHNVFPSYQHECRTKKAKVKDEGGRKIMFFLRWCF